MNIRSTIISEINSILVEQGSNPTSSFDEFTVIFDTGLDSLGFAILVTRLEDKLGFEPFSEMTQAFYPRTFGEFVAVYENRPSK